MKKSIILSIALLVTASVYGQTNDSTKSEKFVAYKLSDINKVLDKVAKMPYGEIYNEVNILTSGRIFEIPKDSLYKKEPIKKP